ncbi:MAG: hypothetical protein JW768_09860, partial [Chitinispirillaceae bacterium]|nr:hypothetical protein [Chitinispirillaceae bacterium]
VAAHFESVNTPLHYISPVNEPQWDWLCSSQEGSQWRTDEIRDIVVAMQSAFSNHHVSTKALVTEAGSIDWIYNNWNNNALTGQLRYWDESDPLYIGDLSVLAPIIAGHSYWTEDTDSRLYTIRRDLANAVGRTDVPINWWQTEYSFLGEGWQDLSSNPTNHELGLFMAKVIYTDLTVGNAAAWQFWETFESTSGLPRYRLVRVDRRQQTASPEKTYWALGHYSRFIRPGMRRVQVERSDNLDPSETLRDIMPTAFIDPSGGNITMVLVNYLSSEQSVRLRIPGVSDTATVTPYLSTGQLDMRRQGTFTLESPYSLPARSIVTLTLDSNREVSTRPHRHDLKNRDVQIHQEPGSIQVLFAQAGGNNAVLFNARGDVVQRRHSAGRRISLCTNGLASGIYLLNARSGKYAVPPKLVLIN